MAAQGAEYLRRFGERLQELRRPTGLNQARMAEVLGVGLSTYAAWERGEFAPRLEQLLRLADWHNISLDYLVGRAGAETDDGSAQGVTWQLAWARPSETLRQGAEIWERLVRGESHAQVTLDLGINNAVLERRVQDLVLSESLIVEEVARNETLERAVRERLTDESGVRLRDVWVADLEHIEWPFVRYVLLGNLAKDHFKQVVREGNSVGLCGGFAVSRMVHSLRRGDCEGGIRVFPIAVTPVFEKAAVSANGCVSALAYRHFDYNVQASELPFVFEEATGNRPSPPLNIARRILEDAARVDFVFMGIGGRDTGALARDITDLQRDFQWLARVDLDVIQQQGQPVGDILYQLVDAAGQPLSDFKERNQQLVCSIGLQGLRALVDRGKRVVVIASGRDKADVTRAAVTGGYVNALIMDDGLARGLLES